MEEETKKMLENVERFAAVMNEGDGLLIQKKGDKFRVLFGAEEDFKGVNWPA